ncbi:tRNA (N(6)-L-threonylcarbamoyladenosine(37)-C(2))-methylthiotransferase MtaB [Breoghania sp.]|uniref:tRNA (N(6)-L-threonylcarbamoyladenosine(37)-C(2))- methylthiotransferase MtaB n=1 Tax=Breoghania sp. TaxID=2065378 RepID=UPI00320498AC
MTIKLVTFGCRLNTYESEIMRREAEAAGLDNAILVNTCAVTGEAVRQARQQIRRARRENPQARIIVTGCAAQIEAETFSQMEEVDLVIGNTEKLERASYKRVADFGIDENEKVIVNDIMSVRKTAGHLIDGLEGRVRAFVQVQNGCYHRRTFCIIPFGRGNSRSVAMGKVVGQIRRLVENGYHEIVLTGVDITSYGADLPGEPKLGTLVEKILKLVPDLERLRLSSIEADDALMRAIAEEPRLIPHFHLSLQSGDNMILKRMKRRHSREDTIAFCEEVRRHRPDVIFGADIIAGFPTETKAMFENPLRIGEDCGLTHLHVFPFSPRKGTPAGRMPQVNRALVKERAARLREAGEAALMRHLSSEIGLTRRILVEREGLGRTGQFTETELSFGTPAPSSRPASPVTAAVTSWPKRLESLERQMASRAAPRSG